MRQRERLFRDDPEGSGTGGSVDPVDDGGGSDDRGEPDNSPVSTVDAPVSREEFDALRQQTARVVKRFNKALKASRSPASTPAPAVDPAPVPERKVRADRKDFFAGLSGVLPRKTKPPTP